MLDSTGLFLRCVKVCDSEYYFHVYGETRTNAGGFFSFVQWFSHVVQNKPAETNFKKKCFLCSIAVIYAVDSETF